MLFGLERLDKYGIFMLCDIPGLGKSIVAGVIAKKRDVKTAIIAPAATLEAWGGGIALSCI